MKNYERTEAARIRDKIMEELRPLLRYDGDLARFTSCGSEGELCERAWAYARAKIEQAIEPLDEKHRFCECGAGSGEPECWCGAPIPISLTARDWFNANHFSFSRHTTQKEADASRRNWREAWEKRFSEAARICAAHGVDADFFEAGGRPPAN